MSEDLPGKETSLWLDTTPDTSYPELADGSPTFDVVIAGGGIAGLLTAWYLKNEGLSVAVVEKARIVQNTTGNTTAKLTSQHNLVYDFLIKEHGEKVAATFANLNQQAITDIENLADKLNIDCDFEAADAYVYTEQDERMEDIQAEVEAAKRLGLPASFETHTDLSFPVKGAIKFTGQAQFHPRKFLLGVAADLAEAGVKIYENTESADIEPGSPAVLKTDKGEIKAGQIVVATKYPFWQKDLFDKVTWVKLSYALGVRLKAKEQYPMGMYISTEQPIRTIRSHPYEDSRLLIFGGESHEMVPGYDKTEHYKNLVTDVKQKYKIEKIMYRWVAGDMMPRDRLPYIGAYPGQPNIYVITGFHAWGLTWGIAAAQIIRDEVLGNSNPAISIFSPSRIK